MSISKLGGNMQLPESLVLVRHGESEGNAVKADDNSFPDKANHDFALTHLGREQARRAGDYLQDHFAPFDVGFVSTFRRTQETMSLMLPDLVPVVDSRLNELWRGIWHTMSRSDIDRLFPMEPAIKKREGWYHYRPPGGQCCADVDLMIYSFLQDLSHRYAGKRVVIAGHGNWMLLLWRLLYGFPVVDVEHRYKEGKYHNGSITVHNGNALGQWESVVENFVP